MTTLATSPVLNSPALSKNNVVSHNIAKFEHTNNHNNNPSSWVLNPTAVRERAKSIEGCDELPSNKPNILSFIVIRDSVIVPNNASLEQKMARVNIFADTGTIGTSRVLNGQVRETFRRNVSSLDVVERLLRYPPTLTQIDDNMIVPVGDDKSHRLNSPTTAASSDDQQQKLKNQVELAEVGLCILYGEQQKLQNHLAHLEKTNKKNNDGSKHNNNNNKKENNNNNHNKTNSAKNTTNADTNNTTPSNRQNNNNNDNNNNNNRTNNAIPNNNTKTTTLNTNIKINTRINDTTTPTSNRFAGRTPPSTAPTTTTKASPAKTTAPATRGRGQHDAHVHATNNINTPTAIKGRLNSSINNNNNSNSMALVVKTNNNARTTLNDTTNETNNTPKSNHQPPRSMQEEEYTSDDSGDDEDDDDYYNTDGERDDHSVGSMDFLFSLPAPAMKHVDQCLKDIAKMGKLVHGVATNGRGTIFLYGNGGVAYTPNIPKTLYHRLKQLRNSAISSRPSYISLGTRDRFFVAYKDGTYDWKGPKALDKILKSLQRLNSDNTPNNNNNNNNNTDEEHSKIPRTISFGNTYETFFIVYKDGSWKFHGRSIPQALSNKLTDRNDRPDLTCVNLGPRGEWFMKAKNGRMWWGGINQPLDDAVQSILSDGGCLHFIDFGEDGSYFLSHDTS